MPEPEISEARVRFSMTVFYGIVAAFEIWGYRPVLAGREVLALARWWNCVVGAFIAWVCWPVFAHERKKKDFGGALVKCSWMDSGLSPGRGGSSR